MHLRKNNCTCPMCMFFCSRLVISIGSNDIFQTKTTHDKFSGHVFVPIKRVYNDRRVTEAEETTTVERRAAVRRPVVHTEQTNRANDVFGISNRIEMILFALTFFCLVVHTQSFYAVGNTTIVLGRLNFPKVEHGHCSINFWMKTIFTDNSF